MSIDNIVLVGFMGTGKTTVGRRLGARLRMPFVDMDERISARTRKDIPSLFQQNGERYFRLVERQVARELSFQRSLVIATGGGVVLNWENIEDLERSGLVVCLTAAPDVIAGRMSRDRRRPLLAGQDPAMTIARLLRARQSLYDRIPRRIDTGLAGTDDAVARIADWYAELRSGGR